jgi:hypothetical protein
MKVISYSSFEEKSFAAEKERVSLSGQEALIRTLDLMDFYARLQAKRPATAIEDIERIILPLKKIISCWPMNCAKPCKKFVRF